MAVLSPSLLAIGAPMPFMISVLWDLQTQPCVSGFIQSLMDIVSGHMSLSVYIYILHM